MVDAAHARQHAAVQPAVCRTHAVLPQLAVMIAAAKCIGLCGLMDTALVFGTKDCRLESCQSHAKHADAALRMCTCVRRLLVFVRYACVSICAQHPHKFM